MNLDFASLRPYLYLLDAAFSDLDGTLVDNEATALDKIGEEHDRHIFASKSPHLNPAFKNGVGNIRHLAGTPIESIRKIFTRETGIPIPLSVEQAIYARRAVEPEPGEIVNCIDPTVDFFHFLKAERVPLTIVTSSERDRATRYIRAAGLELSSRGGLVVLPNNLISGHSDFETPKHKPHPDAYLRALDLNHAHASRTLTFEDTIGGGQASIAAGIPTIGILLGNHFNDKTRENTAIQMLAAGFATVVTRIEEFIPAVTEVIKSMPERRPAVEVAPDRTGARERANLRVVGREVKPAPRNP